MGGRSDVIIYPDLSPRIIMLQDTATEMSAQELHNTAREWEQEPAGGGYEYLIDGSGKEDLGGGVEVGLTEKLRNAKVMFQSRKVWLRTGTITAGNPAGARLIDSGADFVTLGVEPGAWVVNHSDASLCSVMEVVSATELLTDVLGGGTDNAFEVGDSYSIMNVTQCKLTDGNVTAIDEAGASMSAVQPSAGTQVLIAASSSATLIQTAGGPLTPTQQTQLLEIYRRLNLDPTRPLISSPSQIAALPEIDIDVVEGPPGTFTGRRQ